MEKRKLNMNIILLDDLFSTQKQRDLANAEIITNISIKDIENFPDHPFNVEVNQELLDSIKDKGVITPAIVRPKENGKYELISGHRWKKASEELNIETLPCIIRKLTDDEATILMVDKKISIILMRSDNVREYPEYNENIKSVICKNIKKYRNEKGIKILDLA